MFWQQFQIAFLVLCAVGWAASIARSREIEPRNPEITARRDAVRLFASLFASAVLVAVRDLTLPPPALFWALNGLLAPLSVLVVVNLSRLVSRYRQDQR